MATTDSYDKNIQPLNMGCYGINNIKSGQKVTNLVKAKRGEKTIKVVDLTTGDCYGGYNGLDGYVAALMKPGFKAEFKFEDFKDGANVPTGDYFLNGVSIPDNHLINNAFVYVNTAFVGAGASLNFSVEGESATFLQASAEAIATFSAGAIFELKNEDLANLVKVANGGGRIKLTISGAAITAGDCIVFGDLYNLNLSN